MATERQLPREGEGKAHRRVVAGAGGKRLKPTPPPSPGQLAPIVPSTDRGATAVGGSTGRGATVDEGFAARHRERLRSELAEKVSALAERVRRIDESLAVVDAELASQRMESAALRKREADEIRRRAIAALRSATANRREELSRQLQELVERAAPGVFGLDFAGNWLGQPILPAPPSLVRRGSHDGEPVLLPLFHDRGWWLEGPTDRTLEEIETVLVRIIAGLPLKHLRIDVFDPQIEGRLGLFAPLRSASPRTFPMAVNNASALQEVLESAAGSAATNAEVIASEGCRDLGELWELRSTPTGDYRVIVVLNYPEGIDRTAQAMLLRLARSGGPNGIGVIVQRDTQARPADLEVRPQELRALLRASQIEPSGRLVLNDHPEDGDIQSDGEPPAELVRAVISEAAERASNQAGPVVPLGELIASDVARPWQGNSTESLEATIGRDGTVPVTVSLRSENPAVPNILVGGAVGQGKSNLLLDLIYSLAARYSPDDLELHLLDFKNGLEFQRFAADESGRNWLPHAKVLSLESDRSFGFAVLDHIVGELERRAGLFKATKTKGIDDYRRQGGSMPRLLLVIDEFQVIFDGDDDLTDAAVERLERLARQGRASGIHLILSSQTTTGVSGLRLRGEAIFSQFPIRISLKNSPSESEAILSAGNKAAADLTYRGEIVINRNSGHDPEGSNERAMSAYAEDSFLVELQSALWALRADGEPPLVFVSTDFARWPDEEPGPGPEGEPIGLIGRPVAVTAEPVALRLLDDIDQGVAVIGADAELAIPLVAGLTRSIAISGGVHRVVVIDLAASNENSAGASMRSTLTLLERRGVEVLRVGRDRSIDVLTGEVRDRLRKGGRRTLVVGLGWQRWTDLEQTFSVDPDNEFDTYSLEDQLIELAASGAMKDVFLVGWWTSLGALEKQFGPYIKGFRHLIAARLSLDDYRSITPNQSPPVTGYPRVAHIDRGGDGQPMVVVPFDLREAVP